MKERKVVIPYKPLTDLHWRLHCGLKRFSVIVAHRRFGKTVFCVNEIIKRASLCEKKRPQYAYVAPSYKQAKNVVWQYLKEYAGVIPGVKFNEAELRCEWPNGVSIVLLGSENPDSLRGIYLDGVVIDEVAQCAPSLWGEIIRPALSDRQGWAIFIGTPKGKDHFWERYQQALESPDWLCVRLPVSKTDVFGKVIPIEELEFAKRDMSEAEYKQEFECSFEASSDNVLIPLSLVESAVGRNVGYKFAPIIAGLDVGLSLDGDPSALVLRQGGKIIYAEEFKYDNYQRIAGHVMDKVLLHDCGVIAVDGIGWGAGAAQELQKFQNVEVHSINVAETAAYQERFNRQRDELWWKTREWFDEKQCCIPSDLPMKGKLIKELTGVTYVRTPSDKIKVMNKQDMKKEVGWSPNLADALCLTFAVSGKIFERKSVDKPRYLVA